MGRPSCCSVCGAFIGVYFMGFGAFNLMGISGVEGSALEYTIGPIAIGLILVFLSIVFLVTDMRG